MAHTRFTEAQWALLQMFSMKMTKAETNELRTLLANFCAELARRKIEKLEKEGKFPSPETIRNTRMRRSSAK